MAPVQHIYINFSYSHPYSNLIDDLREPVSVTCSKVQLVMLGHDFKPQVQLSGRPPPTVLTRDTDYDQNYPDTLCNRAISVSFCVKLDRGPVETR